MINQTEESVSVRRRIRQGLIVGHTSGLAPRSAQGNVVILPAALADDFLQFCKVNSRACPVIGVSEPGSPALPGLGEDIDIRHDLPRYRVFRDGVEVATPTDVADLWRDDLVTFVIGCSFTFEQPLIDAGVPLRHVQQKRNVAMYRTTIETLPVGPFRGPTVVSMRPMTPADAIRAVQVTAQYPEMHGAPLHFGFPEAIGIADLARPDYGDPIDVLPGEVPVFWACGVTPQAVLEVSRPSFCITHAPGCMLITDRPNRPH